MNRRQRQRREEAKRWAREALENPQEGPRKPQDQRERHGKAKCPPKRDPAFLRAVSFIRAMDAIDEVGEQVAGLGRASYPGKKADRSLESQEKIIRKAVEKSGGKVVQWMGKKGIKGHSRKWIRILRWFFAKVAWMGIRKVVLTVLSRLVRSHGYGNGNPEANPTPEQLEEIEMLAKLYGLTVILVCPPGSSFAEERSHQTKQSGLCGHPKGKKNKYPGWSTERKKRFGSVALAAVDAGKSPRKAAEITNEAMQNAGCFVRAISHETVRKWLQEREEETRGI